MDIWLPFSIIFAIGHSLKMAYCFFNTDLLIRLKQRQTQNAVYKIDAVWFEALSLTATRHMSETWLDRWSPGCSDLAGRWYSMPRPVPPACPHFHIPHLVQFESWVCGWHGKFWHNGSRQIFGRLRHAGRMKCTVTNNNIIMVEHRPTFSLKVLCWESHKIGGWLLGQ